MSIRSDTDEPYWNWPTLGVLTPALDPTLRHSTLQSVAQAIGGRAHPNQPNIGVKQITQSRERGFGPASVVMICYRPNSSTWDQYVSRDQLPKPERF